MTYGEVLIETVEPCDTFWLTWVLKPCSEIRERAWPMEGEYQQNGRLKAHMNIGLKTTQKAPWDLPFPHAMSTVEESLDQWIPLENPCLQKYLQYSS